MRGRAGSFFDISVFPTRISVSGLENFAIWTLHTSYRDESGMNSVTGMASSCFACCIFHIISIKFNYSDTAISVAKAMVGAKVISFCFAMVWFSKFAPETLRGLLSSRKRGWNYLYEPKTKLVPVTGPCEEVPNCIEPAQAWIFSSFFSHL